MQQKQTLKMQQVFIHQNLLKFEVDKLASDKFKKATTGLNSLKSKADKLDVDKLVPVPIDFSKLSVIVKNRAVKKAEYCKLVKNVNAIQTTDISNLVKKTVFDTKTIETEKKILILIIVISILLRKNLKS